MQKQYSALLFPLASLPGPFGIGTLGTETLNFVTTLREKGFSYWQILPLGHVDSSNSPYKSLSSFAGNPAYIDPRFLVSDGLLPNYLLENYIYKGASERADYQFAYENSRYFLKMAFNNITPLLQNSINAFLEKEGVWLEDYALFMTAKEIYQSEWWLWQDKKLRNAEKSAKEKLKATYPNKFWYYVFEQWVFARQWQTIKTKSNSLGLGIIGDLPFYVDADSVDVWSNQDLFELKASGEASKVAGVPPDYFSAEGQLWGNPLYKWQKHKETSYSWWRSRVRRMLDLFDKLRLDHFRAFANYWSVDAEEPNAINGKWKDGPSMDLLSLIFTEFDKSRFIAEDLGVADEKLSKLLKEANLCRMNVLQFSLDGNSDTLLPHNFVYESVTYTGTHDNNTVLGWIWDRSIAERDFILSYLNFSSKEDWGQGGSSSPICLAMIHLAWSTASKITVTCLQDICGFGEDTRINVPGQASGNWVYRLTPALWQKISWTAVAKMNKVFRRNLAYEEQIIEK